MKNLNQNSIVIQILVQFNPNINIHNKGVLYSAPFLIKKINQMKLIKPYFEIEPFNASLMMRNIEKAGRTCYKSEDKITNDSADKFVEMLLSKGHESVIEHEKITVRIICDRGVSHELVRHRIASFSQESTRYCNYAKDKFGNELTFIIPTFMGDLSVEAFNIFNKGLRDIENVYFTMLDGGAKPEEARAILPNALKTEVVTTMNLRSWRHFFELRASKYAHPDIRKLANDLLKDFKANIPVIFDDIKGV